MARIKYSNVDVVKLVSILYVRIYIFFNTNARYDEGQMVIINFAVDNSIIENTPSFVYVILRPFFDINF